MARATALTCSLVIATGTGGLGLGGREATAGEDQLLRQCGSDLAHEPGNPAPCEGDSQLDLGDREDGILRGDAQVAGGHEDQPAADRVAVHLRDGNGAHLLDRVGHAQPVLPDLAAHGPGVAGLRSGRARGRIPERRRR